MKYIRGMVMIGAVLAALVMATTASATQPFRGSFDDTTVFVDSEVCAAAPWGFDVDVVQHEFGFFNAFFDKNGNVVRVLVHNNYDASISANGKTIVERDTWESVFYPDGTSRIMGSTVHIQGPGGIVIKDAGQVVFNADGSIAYAHGPHEQLIDNKSFCPALTT